MLIESVHPSHMPSIDDAKSPQVTPEVRSLHNYNVIARALCTGCTELIFTHIHYTSVVHIVAYLLVVASCKRLLPTQLPSMQLFS